MARIMIEPKVYADLKRLAANKDITADEYMTQLVRTQMSERAVAYIPLGPEDPVRVDGVRIDWNLYHDICELTSGEKFRDIGEVLAAGAEMVVAENEETLNDIAKLRLLRDQADRLRRKLKGPPSEPGRWSRSRGVRLPGT